MRRRGQSGPMLFPATQRRRVFTAAILIMALKFVDNSSYWDDTLPGQPGVYTSTTGCSVAGSILSISGNAGTALFSNRLTQEATYIINSRLSFDQPGGFSTMSVLHATTDFADQGGLALFNTGKWQ